MGGWVLPGRVAWGGKVYLLSIEAEDPKMLHNRIPWFLLLGVVVMTSAAVLGSTGASLAEEAAADAAAAEPPGLVKR